MTSRPEDCRLCRILRLLALGGWLTAILWLSLTPNPPQLSGDVLGWDKAQHAAAYAMLTFLAGRAFELYVSAPPRAWLLATGFSLVVGSLMEVAQGMMTRVRVADPQDMLANAIGALAVYAWVRTRFREGRE